MSSFLFFRCAGCGARIRAPFQLLGQTRPCPGCGHRLLVRLQPPPESGPMLIKEHRPVVAFRRGQRPA